MNVSSFGVPPQLGCALDASGSAMQAGGQRRVLQALTDALAAATPFALGLVANTDGSTYRKPGALVLVAADRSKWGVVSGGCLEDELIACCGHAIQTAAPTVHVFDTRSDDDLVFGSGSGCRGRTQVLILPSTDPDCRAATMLLAQSAETRAAVHFKVVLSGPRAGSGVVSANRQRQSFGSAAAGDEGVEFDVAPCHRVVMIGASPEAGPLLHIALEMGWQTELVDHRAARCTPYRGRADTVLTQRPAVALAARCPAADDAVLVMTHSASADLEALQALAMTEVGYIGLLGPRLRRDELLAELPEATRARLVARLYSPIGLALGGNGPEAIALAIAAQLQQYFCGQLATAEH